MSLDTWISQFQQVEEMPSQQEIKREYYLDKLIKDKKMDQKRSSSITAKTIKKYLDYFEDSFLIESAQRYDIKGKAYTETPKKYYFSDLGLRNARINFRQFEQTYS